MCQWLVLLQNKYHKPNCDFQDQHKPKREGRMHWPMVVVWSVFSLWFSATMQEFHEHISQCGGLFCIPAAFLQMIINSLSKRLIPTCVFWCTVTDALGILNQIFAQSTKLRKLAQPPYVRFAVSGVAWQAVQCCGMEHNSVDRQVIGRGFWPEGLRNHESQTLAARTRLHIPNSFAIGTKCSRYCILSRKKMELLSSNGNVFLVLLQRHRFFDASNVT